MSWSDDDFDVEEEMAENAKKKQEEEMTLDDIEEAAKKKAEAEAAAAPKAKKKEKKKDEEGITQDGVAYDVMLQDPVAEKIRRQKLVEEADARMAADLFSGVDAADSKVEEEKAAKEAEKVKEVEKAVKKAAQKMEVVVRDSFDRLELATQADVSSLLGTCMEKIESGKAKSSAPLFLTHIMKALEKELSSEELKAMDTLIAGIVKGKKVVKTEADTGKRKTNEQQTKNTKFDIHKETAEVYGGGDYDEEWEEEEWWDEGSAAKPAGPAKVTGAKW